MRERNGIHISPAPDVKAFVIPPEIETNGGAIRYHLDNRFVARASECDARRSSKLFLL